NVMQRALVLADGMVIAPEHIMLVARPTSLFTARPAALPTPLAA
ncbi:MAG: sigma-54-dependent Fis family transcriptional regulator, partial [Roseovarius sp.]|nr:sigma-54-dependent Fis family transcriptional regulator [Roseovarius sp.]